MQEKLNNILQDKLEQLNYLPEGVHFDSSAAWHKMEVRLHSKSKNTKMLWYSAAASVVLLLTILLLSRVNHISPSVVVSKKVSAYKNESYSAASDVQPEKPAKVSRVKRTSNTLELIKTGTKPGVESTTAAAIEEQVKLTVTTADTSSKEPVVVNRVTTGTATASAPTARRFRIVHNNETTVKAQTETVETSFSSKYRLPLIRLSNAPETNTEEPAQNEVIPVARRKDRGLMKAIINTFKD